MGSLNDAPLSVTLQMDEATRSQLLQSMSVVAVAEAYVIDSPETANLANTELREIITREKKIEELRKGFVAPAQQIIENARSLFNPALIALGQAKDIIKGRLMAWTTEQQRLADEAKRRAQEDERRRRHEADQKAAAERARAEEQARKAREEARLAEEARVRAEAEARKAREEGDKKAAAEAERRAQAAAAESAKREEEARARIEEGEAKANAMQLTAAASAPTAAASAPTTVAGFSARKNWIAELEPGKTEDQAKVLVVQAIGAGRTDLLSLIDLDMKAAGKLAKALEGNFNVPGMKARNAPVATSRAA